MKTSVDWRSKYTNIFANKLPSLSLANEPLLMAFGRQQKTPMKNKTGEVRDLRKLAQEMGPLEFPVCIGTTVMVWMVSTQPYII